ncbi:MAG TPA: hypothetical protein VFI24_20240 [Pyrinomonadaceae bacterium]|nr:hypothetical protein [Pyrinomonadaceae bacterium]
MKTIYRIAWLAILPAAFALLAAGQEPCPSPSPASGNSTRPNPTATPTPDYRRLSPTVGTGGPVGGPTGLFSIYDAQTLEQGGYRISVAYSNFDRDPGNVDLTEVPVSFQYGIKERMEFFFTGNAYRGIKVNNQSNLSGFYLPNSPLLCGPPGVVCSRPAIILAPSGPNVGTLMGNAIFRPLNNQPFVQFPFVGGSAGTFGLGPGPIGGLFGFPGFNALLGPPVRTSRDNFGAADTFPGIGSPVGGILPGLVLATRILPATATIGPITVPVSFTIAPSYLPDAPFINRPYGSSSFETFLIGAKYRIQAREKKYALAVLSFYRFYRSNADGPNGFDQLQRGASPAGSIGDFGGFVIGEARLTKSLNVSVNSGFILNSNPKGDFPSGIFSLLDRPNEFQNGFAIDVTLKKYFQPIVEVRSTKYVGSQTPNAFNNNPVDVLAGLKVYSKVFESRFEFGFGAAYRRHLNQQDRTRFIPQDSNTSVFRLDGTSVAFPATNSGFPLGFAPSSNPNGFIFQAWFGRRPKYITPQDHPTPDATLQAEGGPASLTLECQPGSRPKGGVSCPPNREIPLRGTLDDVSNLVKMPGYTAVWIADSGTTIITEPGEVGVYRARWVFSDPIQPRAYTVKLGFKDCVTGQPLQQQRADGTLRDVIVAYQVTPEPCDCVACPRITDLALDCPSSVTRDNSANVKISATSTVSNNEPDVTTSYSWTVSAGTVVGDQTGSQITLNLTGVTGVVNVSVTSTVNAPGCPPDTKTATCPVEIENPPEECFVFDAYRDIKFNDEKARLDNFAIWLNLAPGTTGYYVDYAGSGCSGDFFTESMCELRTTRSEKYLNVTRGLSSERLKTLHIPGTPQDTYGVILWICPSNRSPMTDRTQPEVVQRLANADCPAKSGRP